MKKPIALALGALFAAGAAIAQTTQITDSIRQPDDITSLAAHAAGKNPRDVPLPQFVEEPIASTAGANGPDEQLLKSIVDSLNAEASLRNSKITVQGEADTGMVYLTGATLTPDQVKKATEIATAQAGDGKVVNAMLPDWHPSQELPNVAAPAAQG